MRQFRLRDVARITVSNVDKVIAEDEYRVRLCNYVDVYKNTQIKNEMPFALGSATNAELRKFRLLTDDVLITKDSESRDDIGVPAIVKSAANDLICGYHLAILRAKEKYTHGPFLYWYLVTKRSREEFANIANGVTRFGLTLSGLKGLPIRCPDLPTQRRIADFLDRETARIDRLIEKKTRLAEVLKEKRQALITQAVTKGLDPTVPMKDSGVEWIGEVPVHWDIARLRFVVRGMKAGPFGSALTKDMYTVYGYRVYGQEQVIPGDFSIGNYFISEETYRAMRQYEVFEGDILVSCVGTFGKIATFPKGAPKGIINPRLIRIRPRAGVLPEYLELVLKSQVVFQQMAAASRGGTMDIINIGILSELWIPLPNETEQRRVLEAIRVTSSRISRITAETEKSVVLLKERRAALITAAVTGQIDLTTWDRTGATERQLDALQAEMTS